MRNLIDIVENAQQPVVSQQELMAAYQQQPVKPTPYQKVAVEAIIPMNSKLGQTLNQKKGEVDAAKYNEQHPYIVIQGLKKPPNYDIYTNTQDTLQTKMPYGKPDQLLMSALKILGINLADIRQAGGGLYMKKAITYMIPAKTLNMEGRTIDAGWGTQEVQPGGFLVLEGYPKTIKIYCVNPDASGLPIGYVEAGK